MRRSTTTIVTKKWFEIMNARTSFRLASFRWLIFAGGVLYLLYFTVFRSVASGGVKNEDLMMTASIMKIERSRCCVGPRMVEDVCGRANCTRDCLDPIRVPIDDDGRENAFFLETSGSGILNIRQACAVETLAFHNRNLNVNVFFMEDGQKKINRSKVVETVQKLQIKYKNIQIFIVSLDEYLAGTVLEKWYHCTNWRKGPYHVSHLSDGLRFLTLNKYGGYYFDLDVLMVKPVTYYRNFVSSPSDYTIASNSIHADLANPIMEMAIKDFVSNYRSDIWAHNGPALLLRVLQKWCMTNDVGSMNYVRCKGFHVLNKSSFNPIYYEYWRQLFAQRPAHETGKPKWLNDQVIGVHVCNKLSYNEPVYKNSTQEYTRLARDNCPNIFSMAPETF